MNWRGVFPAITTPFREDLAVDHEFLARHVDRLIRAATTAGVDALNLRVHVPGITTGAVRDQIARIGSEVVAEVRHRLGPR